MPQYFSDREQGPKAQVNEEITETVWGGIIALIHTRITDGSFGYRFPMECPDGNVCCGCNEQTFRFALQAEVPGVSWPASVIEVPDLYLIMDLNLIEFCYNAVGNPIITGSHSYFRHNHINFDREEGQRLFREDINRIFKRNGIAFELNVNGEIIRIISQVFQESIVITHYKTGDGELDKLISDAVNRFIIDLCLRQTGRI